MKKTLLALVIAAVVGMGPQAFAGIADDLYTDAQRAYISGRLEEAQKKFEQVLEIQPDNKRARNYLGMISVALKQQGGSIEKQLSGITLPKVEFKEATFNSALEYVRQEISRISGKKTEVNFVLQLPDTTKETAITLNLTNIPASELLRYMGELAKVRFKYEAHAILVKPADGDEEVATPAS